MKSLTIRLFVLGFVSISILGFSNQVTPPADESAQSAPSTWQGFAPLGRGIASVEFPMLTYEQIRKMPAKDVYRYYHKLHLLMAELEKFQRLDKKSDKFSRLMHHLLINSSDANTETFPPYRAGNDCLIGGYWGKWTYRKDIPGIANKNGMTCISEHRCELPGDTAGGYSSGHKCNPKYFTYENASTRNEWCVNLKKDLTSNGCIALLEKRYNEMCDQDKSQGCRPFADHFKRSVLQAIAADAKYQGISEAEAVNQYRNEVFTEFERIRNYCGDTKEEWDRHSAGQQYSCFRLMSHYQQLQDTVDEIAPEPLPVPVPAQPAQNADGLGPYACIKSGLDQGGYPGASNKHIAMFAVRAKDQSDGIFLISQLSGKKARRRTTMENTILSIASVGVCKGPSLSSDEARKTSDWLNKNRLNDLNDTEYARVFGEDKIHVIPRGGWRNVTFKKRRSMWDSKVENPTVRSCPQQPSESDSVRLCQIMSRACGINHDICSNKPPQERESSDNDNDNPHGGGSTTGGGTTTGAGPSESGPGNNADSYRADRGGGHGGPGGPGEN